MRGFTLIELLVSILLFSMVILGVYTLFDEGQWFYLHSERRSHMQENARLVVEQMERDFRMIGAGVPLGLNPNTGASWLPFIFDAGPAKIAFTGDVDNGTHELTKDVGTVDNSHIFIGPPPHYYKSMDADNDSTLDENLPIILVNNRRSWENLIATSLDSADKAIVTSSAVQDPPSFQADRSMVHTLERVFYRMVDQTGAPDADGICTDPYPFCSIQRQEFRTNDPTQTTPNQNAWVTIGINVTSLELNYYTAINNPVAIPLELANVDKITIRLRCRDRSRRQGQFQDSLLTSEVLIRNRKL